MVFAFRKVTPLVFKEKGEQNAKIRGNLKDTKSACDILSRYSLETRDRILSVVCGILGQLIVLIIL
jgi:hypothetical protein